MTQEALKLALDALITITDAIYVNSQQEADAVYKANDAITAIKEALAQTEQEPVIDKSAATRIATSLGWSPQRTWVGLSEDELERLIHNFGNDPHTLLDEVDARLRNRNT